MKTPKEMYWKTMAVWYCKMFAAKFYASRETGEDVYETAEFENLKNVACLGKAMGVM